MSLAKREQPTVLRWDDVVELVRRGNVAPPRRVTFPFPQKGRPAGAHADVGAGQSANLLSHTSAAKLLGDLVSGVSGHTLCLYAKTMRRKPGLRLVGGREMSKEINNDHPFASTAVDDGYHSQHRLKEATMIATRIRRRWLAAFIVACIYAFAAVTLAQSADPSNEQGAAGEPYSNMPLIAPIEKIPPGYRDWRLISVAHEAGDLNDLRAILGNDKAIKAYREGKLPFPEGTIIARIAWRHVPSEENNKAFGRAQSFVPGDAPPWYLQFMIKDSKKYAATGGWGYAQFDKDGKPGPEADLKKCFPCHQAIKDRDFVFTRYAP